MEGLDLHNLATLARAKSYHKPAQLLLMLQGEEPPSSHRARQALMHKSSFPQALTILTHPAALQMLHLHLPAQLPVLLLQCQLMHLP